jgi:hypothetical protein
MRELLELLLAPSDCDAHRQQRRRGRRRRRRGEGAGDVITLGRKKGTGA